MELPAVKENGHRIPRLTLCEEEVLVRAFTMFVRALLSSLIKSSEHSSSGATAVSLCRLHERSKIVVPHLAKPATKKSISVDGWVFLGCRGDDTVVAGISTVVVSSVDLAFVTCFGSNV